MGVHQERRSAAAPLLLTAEGPRAVTIGLLAGLRLHGETDMAKKRNSGRKVTRPQKGKSFSRRDFFKSGAAAGVSAAVLSGPGKASAQGIAWNYEVDVVVCGAGCTGLHAAIRARDLEASVLVVDSNF